MGSLLVFGSHDEESVPQEREAIHVNDAIFEGYEPEVEDRDGEPEGDAVSPHGERVRSNLPRNFLLRLFLNNSTSRHERAQEERRHYRSIHRNSRCHAWDLGFNRDSIRQELEPIVRYGCHPHRTIQTHTNRS